MTKPMQNRRIQQVGLFEDLTGVITQEGVDRKSVNPHSYRWTRVVISPSVTTSWYGYTGSMIGYKSEPASGIAGVDPRLTSCRTRDPWFQPVDWSRLREKSLAKIFEQLRGNSELLIDLAESGQTLKMLKAAASVKSYMTNFVKDVISSARTPSRIPAIASNKWLEARYGWMPLAHSLYDAADNIGRRLQDQVYTVQARSGLIFLNSSFTSTQDAEGRHNVNQSERVSARCELSYNFSPPPRTQQQIANWTSINPLSIAWELIPYSFVADWFVNVGETLRAWENHVLYSQYFLGGRETLTLRKIATGFTFDGIPQPNPRYYPDGSLMPLAYGYRSTCSASLRSVHFDRTKLLYLPTPASVRLNINLNAKRIADTAALTKRQWSRIL
jgi:hypothetical protein